MYSVLASGSRDAHAPCSSPERGNTFGAPSACCADHADVEYSDENPRTVLAHCGAGGGGSTSTEGPTSTMRTVGHSGVACGRSASHIATPTAAIVTHELT